MLEKKIPNIAYKDFLLNQKAPDRDNANYVPFWLKHIEYCKSGVIVGGIEISGWLYWHLNFFKIPVDDKDQYGNKIRSIKSPPLRDNEYYIDWGRKQGYKQQKPMMIFGSRRIAKSTVLASDICYTLFLMQNSDSLVVGGSAKDIGHITDYIVFFYSNRPDCFSDLMKFGDFTKEGGKVEIAFSKREVTKKDPSTGKPRLVNPITEKLLNIGTDNKYIFSILSISNLEHGTKHNKREMLAGGTPSKVIFDEVGKFSYSLPFAALKPALIDSFGEYRTIPLFVGTGGDLSSSMDAERDFLNADTNGFTVINTEEYKNLVTEGNFQYTKKSNTQTGFFAPAQMCNAGGAKKEIPLQDYIRKDYTKEEIKELEGFYIQVTDWEEAPIKIATEIAIERKKSDMEGKKAQMYYPFQPEDCFLYSGKNPFPVEEAKLTLQKIKETGATGENILFTQDKDGTIHIESSDKKIIADYPYKGGTHDAPVVIYERPIYDDPTKIRKGVYVAGFDGYKIAESQTTDSVGTFYIYKRMCGIEGLQNQIVLSFATRPTMDSNFYRQVMLATLKYNADLLPERDTNLYNFLVNHNMEHLIVNCQSVVFKYAPNSNANTTYGLPATPQNKEHYLKMIQNYCNKVIAIGEDELGNTITIKGVERITDPMLLQELIEYGKEKNADRLAAFGHALVWDNELQTRGVNATQEEHTTPERKEIKRPTSKYDSIMKRHNR